jgi:hypothetical protein
MNGLWLLRICQVTSSHIDVSQGLLVLLTGCGVASGLFLAGRRKNKSRKKLDESTMAKVSTISPEKIPCPVVAICEIFVVCITCDVKGINSLGHGVGTNIASWCNVCQTFTHLNQLIAYIVHLSIMRFY